MVISKGWRQAIMEHIVDSIINATTQQLNQITTKSHESIYYVDDDNNNYSLIIIENLPRNPKHFCESLKLLKQMPTM